VAPCMHVAAFPCFALTEVSEFHSFLDPGPITSRPVCRPISYLIQAFPRQSVRINPSTNPFVSIALDLRIYLRVHHLLTLA
jgi:hypothetical protein